MSYSSLLFAGLLAQHALAGPALGAEHLETRQSASITVNTAQTFQTMDGFGFSEAFSFVNGLFNLPSAAQTQGLDFLFNPTTGAGLTIVRNRIPSGSDSIAPNSPGSPTAAPKYVSIGTDDNQIWFSQKAQSYGIKTFYADAWSAPGYMKTNGNEAGGGYLCGVTGETCASGDWRQAYANYLVQYIKDYQAAGINITYVGFLNEPEFAATYSAMLSDGTKAASFINILYPTIQAAGLTTGITCCDAEGWDSQKTFTAQLISAGVESKLARITSHSYTSKPDGPISTKLRVWQTEYADLDGTNIVAWYTNGNIGEGLTWANNIYQAVVNSNCSAYLYWIGIQSGDSDAGLMFIENNAPIATGKLWAFGQWSRYVQPGAIRLGTTGSTSTLLTSAFKNTNGAISVQVINNGASAETVSVSLTGATASSATAFVTSNSNNNIGTLSVTVSGGIVSGSVPARSMVTFVITAGGSSGTSPTPTPPSTSTSTATPSKTSTASGTAQTEWGQCGGIGWTGLTSCQSPFACSVLNAYYSQCL